MRPLRPTMLLSFDLEDWAQLAAAELGQSPPAEAGRAFERQARVIFDLLDATRSRATFFFLGATMRDHPDVAREVARRGDEVACHGYGHERVCDLRREAFRRDVEAGIETAEKLTGRRPIGYRAPVFSITRDAVWALEVLADLGFAYDSSFYDSPRVPRRVVGIPAAPCRLGLPSGRELVEFPLACWRRAGVTVPFGGGSYWRLIPGAALRLMARDLGALNPTPAFYFHPGEFDPEPLVAGLAPGATRARRLRAAWINARFGVGQGRVLARLRAALEAFPTARCEDALFEVLCDDRARSISPDGRVSPGVGYFARRV